ARVDASGCPLFPLPGVGESTPIRNVLFRAGSAILLPSSRATLDQVATAMQASPDARWEVGGHTDATGLAAQNQRLSQARAQAVADYFASRGVASGSVSAVGYGSTRPVASNATPSGRAQNRRVELKRVQ
ncbi:MAG: OmpA family protein, partial [Gemmatimonadetes bacterium]|nr:OmpA family protein [Gemmatimonadota bacterium]